MRTVTPTPSPPACLTEQPNGQDWYTFMQIPCHIQVGDSLRQDQQHLCCYCEREVSLSDSHIEHLIPRSIDSGLHYQYTNLSASCDGGIGSNRHCGHFKGNKYSAVQFSSPHDPTTHELFRYLLNGVVKPASDSGPQKDKAEYMIESLNLNCPRLVGQRKAHFQSLSYTLKGFPALSQARSWATQEYLHPGTGGRLKSFYSVTKAVLAV